MTTFADGLYQYGGVPVTAGVPALGGPPTGNVFYVQTVTGVNAGAGKSPTAPYATLAYAMTQATANNGDVIYIMPGSTITVSDATSLPFNVAGLNIIGLGAGSQRAIIDFTTANTATIPVSAANIVVQNLRFRASFLSIAAAFTLSTAAGFMLDNCVFFDASAILDFLNIVKSTGAANTVDRIILTNNRWVSLGTTSVNSFLLTANDIERAVISGNTITQATTVDAAILLTVTAGVLTNFDATYNRGYRNNTTTAGGSLINVGGTTSTGFVSNNYVQTLTTTADKIFTTTVGLAAFNNYSTGVKGASGFLIPTADS